MHLDNSSIGNSFPLLINAVKQRMYIINQQYKKEKELSLNIYVWQKSIKATKYKSVKDLLF